MTSIFPTVPLRSAPTEHPAIQFFFSPSMPSILSSFSSSLESSTTLPRKRCFYLHQELPPPFQPDSLPPDLISTLTQLSPADQAAQITAVRGPSHPAAALQLLSLAVLHILVFSMLQLFCFRLFRPLYAPKSNFSSGMSAALEDNVSKELECASL